VITVPHTLERWRLQWQQRPRRERCIIIALAALVAVSLLWLWLWLPLTRHLQQLQSSLPFAQAQLKQAQQQFSESVGLSSPLSYPPPAPATTDARTAIQRAAAHFNIAAGIVTLDVQQSTAQNTVSITFSTVPFDTLVQWIEMLQREEHFYVTAATLTPLTNAAGQLRAELILVRPSS
jgi:type II secretory pathway component PulM